MATFGITIPWYRCYNTNVGLCCKEFIWINTRCSRQLQNNVVKGVRSNCSMDTKLDILSKQSLKASWFNQLLFLTILINYFSSKVRGTYTCLQLDSCPFRWLSWLNLRIYRHLDKFRLQRKVTGRGTTLKDTLINSEKQFASSVPRAATTQCRSSSWRFTAAGGRCHLLIYFSAYAFVEQLSKHQFSVAKIGGGIPPPGTSQQQSSDHCPCTTCLCCRSVLPDAGAIELELPQAGCRVTISIGVREEQE